jgi:hypothetical protein
MKRFFKIGFVAFVAVLAMSFTVASKTNVLGTTIARADIESGCYSSVTTDPGAPPSNSQNFQEFDGPTVTPTGPSRLPSTCTGTSSFCCYVLDHTGKISGVYYFG